MLKINGLAEGLEVFKTLGSEVRLRIVKLLSEKGEMNLNEIADALDLTNGALTAHIRKLEESGIINVVSENTGRGNFKVCSLKEDSLFLDLRPSEEEQNIKVYETDIRCRKGIMLIKQPFRKRSDTPVRSIIIINAS